MDARLALTLAGIFMFAAVALGAFGAHMLRGHLDPDMTAVWQSAVQYHAWHALALLGVGSVLLHWPGKRGLSSWPHGYSRRASCCSPGACTPSP